MPSPLSAASIGLLAGLSFRCRQDVDYMNGFIRSCGILLILGAVLLIVINAFLSPFYLQHLQHGEVAFRSSEIYFFRLSAASVDALLLLFGCLGLHLGQRSASGKFGAAAFSVTFVGTSLVFAIEWANLFVLRPVAQTSPGTFEVLNESLLMTVGFASGAGLFMLGWLLFSVSLWLANVLPRWAALTALVGLISIVAVSPLGSYGQIPGNVIFGVGLMGLGNSLAKMK